MTGKSNPYQCAIDLWNDGLVPSFDGKTWCLYGGKDAGILYEMKNIRRKIGEK